jgi:hypothetical protein
MILTNTNLSIFARRNNEPPTPAAPVNVVLPSLTGTGLVGSTITCNKGTWTGYPTPSFEYNFKADGVSVQLGISNEYVTAGPDINKVITCEVTATNSQGSASATTSNSITVGTAPVNTVAPTVSPSGTQITGTVITASVGTWTGTPTITYEYRWTRNGTPISGATNSTYTIQAADDGTTIRVEVRGTNAYGTSAYVTSSNSVSAVNAVAPVNTVPPVISGTAVVGQTLTSTTGTWTGTPTPTYSYQWRRNGVDIGGATASTYTLVQADAGNTSNITCVVTATNTAGSASATSNTIARILDALANAYITGLTLTSAEIDSFNDLYISIRNNNYHNEIDNLIIYATATSAAALKPLFGNNVITPVNSPVWVRKQGYRHTGTSYINRGTSQNVRFTANNHIFMFGCANKNTTTNGTNGGQTSGAGPCYVTLTNTASVNTSSLSGQDNNVFTRNINNRDYAILRQSSTQYRAFQDGVASVVLNRTTTPPPPTLLFDGAYNAVGSPTNLFENGSFSTYSLQGSGSIDPAIMRNIINTFINSL